MLRKLLSKWPTNSSSSLPSTGWILLVNNIFWHLPPLGKIRPQLLYRTSGEQLAHGAGAQWLLHPSRPKWHTLGRQRRHYQRMYLGILGKGERCQSGKGGGHTRGEWRGGEVVVQRLKCSNGLASVQELTNSRHLFQTCTIPCTLLNLVLLGREEKHHASCLGFLTVMPR